MSANPSAPSATAAEEASIYDLFIGLMSIVSIVIMALMLLTPEGPSKTILAGADFLLCMLFLVDFARSYRRAPVKREYFFWRGLIDLLGSIPGAGVLRFLRFARVFRILRLVRSSGSSGLARQMIKRRAEAAGYTIVVGAFVVLIGGSYLMAAVEPSATDSNIKDAADAFWWAFVTITTVGYGDRFPVTEAGRVIGMLTMATGIAIFGLLTSFITKLFMSEPADQEAEAAADSALLSEVSALRAEIAALRAEVTDTARQTSGSS
jgi:voltage-gated potassium channel